MALSFKYLKKVFKRLFYDTLKLHLMDVEVVLKCIYFLLLLCVSECRFVCAAIYFWRSEDSCGVGFLVMWIQGLNTGHQASLASA